MSKHTFLIPVLMVLTLGVVLPRRLPAADEPGLPTREQLDRAFAWFDGLGFPSVKGRPFVTVSTGDADWFSEPPAKQFIPAFLLEEKGETFVVLTLGLEKAGYTKTPPGTEPMEQVYYRKADLREWATSALDSLAAGTFRDRPLGRRELGKNGRVFALARHCASHGHLDLASRLCAHLLKQSHAGTPIKDVVERDFEWFITRRAFDAQGDLSLSRPEVLERFRVYLRAFPDEFPEACRKDMDLLEQMIKEDEEHARKQTKPLEKMTQQERIAELIWRLRDQRGYKFSNPGTVDFFVERYGQDPDTPKFPASQLLDIGLDAVPRLVEAMTDTRFTRAMDPDWGQDYRVGDCAWVILQEIAARDFGWDQTKTVDQVGKETIAAAQAKVRKWLADFQKKGEKQMLIEGTAAGDESSPKQAARLIEKYPEAALKAVTEGARNAEGWTRERLVQTAAALPGDGPVPFLLEEMNAGEAPVLAATALLKRGRPEAVPAMIALWNKEKTRQGSSDLIAFLASCGDPAGVRALGKDFGTLPVATRFSIISALGPRGGSVLFVTAGGEGPALPQEESRKQATDTAAQEVLIAALDDTEAYWGCRGTWNGKGFTDPRVCDMAGLVVSMRWPKKCFFDIDASLFERNVARVVLQNVWRKEHGLAELPLPERRKPPEIAPEVAAPLFARLKAARTDQERRKAAAAIEAHGLLALPPALRHLDGLEKDAEVRPTLEDLARRLSCIVAEATFTKDSVKPDEEFRKVIEDLRGKPLTADAFMGVLYHVVRRLPPGTVGIRLEAVREDDGAGVTLKASLLGEDYRPHGSPWSCDESVEIGGKYAGGKRGAAARSFLLEGIAHAELIAGIAKALNAPVKERFRITATIARAKEE